MESQHNQLTLSFVNINSTFKSKCNKSTNFFKSINSIILPILFYLPWVRVCDLFQFLLDGTAIVLDSRGKTCITFRCPVFAPIVCVFRSIRMIRKVKIGRCRRTKQSWWHSSCCKSSKEKPLCSMRRDRYRTLFPKLLVVKVDDSFTTSIQ